MRSTFTLLLLSILPLSYSVAQTCTERLQEAQAMYDEGRIHDLVDQYEQTWGLCLNDNDEPQDTNPFTIEEKVSAFRLLTLVYLQRDEPDMADEYMLKLLATDPEYIINEAVDPTEFINLYNTFRTDPIFRIGVRGGLNSNFSHMVTRDNILANPEFPSTTTPTISWQAGLSMEFDVFKGKRTLQDFIINPELFYSSKKVVDSYEEDWRTGTYTGTFNSLQLQGIVHYEIPLGRSTMRRIRLLASTGPAFEYRLSVLNQANGTILVGDEIIESPSIDASESYKAYDFGWVVGAGFRLKVGRPWATLDVRYNYNFIQVVENRYADINTAITNGGFIRNDQRFQTVSVNAGIHFPIFKHEKLID